jgi:hypothetical protein
MMLRNKGHSTRFNHEKGTCVFRDLVGTVLVEALYHRYAGLDLFHNVISDGVHFPGKGQS